jgi:hypothetical protein
MLFDVEGAEHSLLKGAINTIVDNQVPYIVTEINNGALKMCLTSQMALRSYMSIYGYEVYFLNTESADKIPPGEQISLKVDVVIEQKGTPTAENMERLEEWKKDSFGSCEYVFNILFKHLTAK